MGIRFSLEDFARTGAEVATASIQGKLAAQQELAQQAQQRLQQQHLLSQIAGEQDFAKYRQAEMGRWAGEDAEKRNERLLRTGEAVGRSGDTAGAASLYARSLGGTGQPELALPTPPTGPTPFPPQASVMAPQPPLQVQGPKGGAVAGLMQHWGLGGAVGVPPQMPQALPTPTQAPPTTAPPPTFAYPSGGRITAQPDLRKDAAALYSGLQRTLTAARTAVGLTSEAQAQINGLEQRAAVIGYPHTPEQLQELGEIQAQLNNAIQGKVGPGPGIAARQQTAAATLEQRKTAEQNKTIAADKKDYSQRQKYIHSEAFGKLKPESALDYIQETRVIGQRLGIHTKIPDQIFLRMTPAQQAAANVRQEDADTRRGSLGIASGRLSLDAWKAENAERQRSLKEAGLTPNAAATARKQVAADAAKRYFTALRGSKINEASFNVDTYNPKGPNASPVRTNLAHLYHVWKSAQDDYINYITGGNRAQLDQYDPGTRPPPSWQPWQGGASKQPTQRPGLFAPATTPPGATVPSQTTGDQLTDVTRKIARQQAIQQAMQYNKQNPQNPISQKVINATLRARKLLP